MSFKKSLERVEKSREMGQSVMEYILLTAIVIILLISTNFVKTLKDRYLNAHFDTVTNKMGVITGLSP